MSTSRDVIKKVKDSYVNKRGRAIALSEERKQEVYSAIPQLRSLDAELSQTAYNVFMAISGGKDTDTELAAQREKNGWILEKRRALLKAAGYPEDYTDVRFECSLCNDNGYVGIDMCSCMKRAIAMETLNASGLGRLARSQSFESFRLDYYKGADRTLAEINYKTLKAFAEKFSPEGNESFLLIGNTGLGKTHLSTATAVKVIEKGYQVTYETMQALMDDFSENQFRGGSPEGIAKYYDADLLIIDDLGSELTNQFTVSVMYNLINQRSIKNKSTIFSTNLTQKELRERYADRIVSRLFGVYNPLLFNGQDIRNQKLTEARR